MPRVLIVDTFYGEVVRALPVDPSSTYEHELERIMSFSFGTSNFYNRGLTAHGWECRDVVFNHPGLQGKWATENDYSDFGGDILEAQMYRFQPDVVFMQDLSVPLSGPKPKVLAGQCSCPMPSEANVKRFDVLFSSFPHYLPRFKALGVKAVFNPLAFDPIVLERTGPITGERSGVVFVGGVGNPSHWKTGMETLETVAREIPEFSWYGYGLETLPANSPLRRCYKGQAWGLDYYRIMSKASIVLNRHGEIAGDHANNMRMYEATGVGAMLLTDWKSDLDRFFSRNEAVDYSNPYAAVDYIRYYLANPKHARQIAEAGQRRTLRDHTYTQRMKTISDTLRGML